MATPTTVEEYLRQIPNPSPCPHSPTPNDPPCRTCVENRIKVANSLRAGQDPTAVLGLKLGANGGPSLENGTPLPVEPQPEITVADVVQQLVDNAPPVPEGAFVAPGELDPLQPAQQLTMQTDEQWLPGMTRTEPVSAQPEPPKAAAVATEMLAQLTGGQIATTAPPGVAADPLALDLEQLQRRAEIDAGTHPAVAPVAEPAAVIPPPPEPSFTTEIGGKTYLTIQQNSVGQSYGWTGTEWELIEIPPDAPAVLPALPETAYSEAGAQLEVQEHAGTGVAMEPVEGVVLSPGPWPADGSITPETDVIAQAAEIARPVQVDPSELTAHCEHGFPGTDFTTTPPRSASCSDCLLNSEGPPPHLSKLKASRFQVAHLTTTCARSMCHREIHPGEVIGLVDGVGWCCAVCTKPDQRATA